MLATVMSKRFSAPFFLLFLFFFKEQPAGPNNGEAVPAKVTDSRQVEDETMTRGQQR